MKDFKIAIFDMEWTSWKGSHERNWSHSWEKKEIVQIGVSISKNLNKLERKKNFFFKVKKKKLSKYFQILTGISQNHYNRFSKPFNENFLKFKLLIRDSDFIVCNGKDKEILIENLQDNKIRIPKEIKKIKDIRPILAKILELNQSEIISSELPKILGLRHSLRKHDAIADSIAIFKSLKFLFEQKKIKKNHFSESIV